MKGINFKVIPHKKQRYETVGDWWTDKNDVWQIRVSKMSDWKYEFLVFFHEILEMAWCKFMNVSQDDVDTFDKAYKGDGEPGDETEAPYYVGHQIAGICERIASIALEVNWQEIVIVW